MTGGLKRSQGPISLGRVADWILGHPHRLRVRRLLVDLGVKLNTWMDTDTVITEEGVEQESELELESDCLEQ